MDFFPMQFFTESQVLTVPWAIDYFSVIVGAFTGALVACERKLDIIGTVVAGLLTGYGGGITRDLLMQDYGVYFTSDPNLILICIFVCAFVFYFRGLFRNLDATVFFSDALSVGLFALAGASKAFTYNQGFLVSIILGAITGVGGGALRDICTGVVPSIFRQSNFYAVASLGGSFAYVLLAWANWPLPLAGAVCVFVVGFLRYWSVYFDWKTHSDVDFTRHISHGIKKTKHVVKGVFLQGGKRPYSEAYSNKKPRRIRRRSRNR